MKDRLPLKLPLSPHGYNEGGMPDVVVQVSWLPGSSSRLAVASLHCVWLYDLSASASQPAAKIELPQGGPLVSFACAQRIACLDSAAPSGAPELSLAGCPADSQSQVAVKVTVLAVLCQDGSLSATEVPGDDEQLAENMRVTGNGFTTRQHPCPPRPLACYRKSSFEQPQGRLRPLVLGQPGYQEHRN